MQHLSDATPVGLETQAPPVAYGETGGRFSPGALMLLAVLPLLCGTNLVADGYVWTGRLLELAAVAVFLVGLWRLVAAYRTR